MAVNELLARLWRLGKPFRPDDLPAGMRQVHRELAAAPRANLSA